MHRENFKADFLKIAYATHATFKNITFTFSGVEMWYKYQNNEQYLQIPDVQLRLILWEWVRNTLELTLMISWVTA